MGADLDDVLCLDVEFDLFPIAAVLFEGVEKGLMFGRGPVFPMLGYDIRLAGLFSGKGIGGKRRK